MTLKNHYKNSFEIIKKHKKPIFMIFTLYAVSLLCGIIYYNLTYEGFSSIEVKEGYYQTIKEIELNKNFFVNFFKIFTHNITASLFRMLGGIALGIIPFSY